MKITFLLIIISSTIGFSQDFHFSQISENPMLINPATTGVFKGWERIGFIHRNQWIGANTQFMTSSLLAEANFMKNRVSDNAHFGVGVNLYNDVGGDSKFGIQNASVSLSGILPINSDGHLLSAGIQTGFTSRKSDLSRVYFENQWNGNTFDPLIGSGEPTALQNFRHFDAAAGLMYQYDAGSSSFSRRNNEKLFRFGIAVYHVNKPSLEYTTSALMNHLYRKFVFHTSYTSDIESSFWSYDLNIIQFIQGPHRETLLGASLKNRFQSGTKITGFYQDAYFGFGLYTRLFDAIIPKVFVDFSSFKLAMSYDVTISQLRKAHKGGSIEISLIYSNLDHALFKKGR